MKEYKCKNCKTLFLSNKGCKSRTPKFCTRKCSAIYNLSLDSVRKKMSIAKIGKTPWNKGVQMWKDKEHPKGTKGMRFPANSGSNCRFWKGGVSSENEKARKSPEYNVWRESVFKRDDFTCKICNKKGGELNADHIKSFAHHKELRFEIDNGRTLCVECHRKTDNYGSKAIKK